MTMTETGIQPSHVREVCRRFQTPSGIFSLSTSSAVCSAPTSASKRLIAL